MVIGDDIAVGGIDKAGAGGHGGAGLAIVVSRDSGVGNGYHGVHVLSVDLAGSQAVGADHRDPETELPLLLIWLCSTSNLWLKEVVRLSTRFSQ